MSIKKIIPNYLDCIAFALDCAKQKNVKAEIGLRADRGFSVSARASDVETLEHIDEKGLSITIYHQHRTGSASTTDLSKEAINTTVEKAYSIAHYAGEDIFSGLADPALLAHNYPDLELHHPWQLSPSEAIQMAIECETIAREQDPRINDAEGASVSTYESCKFYANTDNFIGYYPTTTHSVSCGVVATDGEDKQREFEYSTARKATDLDDISFIAKHAAEKTLARLGARKIKTQKSPVIFHATAAKGLLGNFIAAVSGSNLYRETTFLLNRLNTPVFPKFIDIYQRPHIISGIGSKPFDSDGVATKDRHYIKDGELVSYVLGSYSARKLGLQSTGNSGGVYNLTISHSDENLHALFKKMGRGLFVTDLMGQGVRIVTGDYSRGASGFWIENGEIQFPVFEITISGNLKDMYSQIVAIGNDIDRRGNIQTGSILIENMTIAGE